MKGVWFQVFFLSDQKFYRGHIKTCQSLLYVRVPLYLDHVHFISQSSLSLFLSLFLSFDTERGTLL